MVDRTGASEVDVPADATKKVVGVGVGLSSPSNFCPAMTAAVIHTSKMRTPAIPSTGTSQAGRLRVEEPDGGVVCVAEVGPVCGRVPPVLPVALTVAS